MAPTTQQVADATDFFYYMMCGCMVFLMQLGFAMLEVGAVHKKNVNNIILKGTLDILICGIAWWAMGFAIAFGAPKYAVARGEYRFIGGKYNSYYFGNCLDGYKEDGDTPTQSDEDACAGYEHRYPEWFFQFAFAATAATIVSGAVAERTTTTMYVIYSLWLTCWVYPVVVHWQWGHGWAWREGAVDYAGSGIVHMTGGCAAIIGAAVVGPRKGRFEGSIFKVKVNELPQNSVVFSTIGTILLWFGWYGFNTGSTLGIVWVYSSATGVGTTEAGLVLINTTLAPCAAGLTAMMTTTLITFIKTKKYILELPPVLNGVLAGLVAITAGCADVRPWAAVVMGIIGGLIYVGSSNLQKMLKIDDVVDAGPVHFWNGMWGVFGLGLFADNRGTGLASAPDYGAFYGGGGELLGDNVALMFAIIGWVTAMMAPLFILMKVLGLARVSNEVEDMGLDVSKHGISAEPATGTAEPKAVEVREA